MPLNLRDAGINDRLAKLEQVVETAMADGAMLYNPREPEAAAVRRIVQNVYATRVQPLAPPAAALQATDAATQSAELHHVFSDSTTFYQVVGGFLERLKDDPEIGRALQESQLCVRFEYTEPLAVLTIDARGTAVQIYRGESFIGNPEVTMRMSADFAHAFWHGRINLVSALTRRQVTAKGNLPKTLRLLPILKPAYALYPQYLAELGMADKILR